MMQKKAITVKDALLQGAAHLKKIGLTMPRLEAEVILCHILNWKKATLYTYPEKSLTQKQHRDYLDLISLRGQRVPSAYLTGKKEFMGLEFKVNSHVLIPRPETEVLVENIIEACQQLWPDYQDSGKKLDILDIGTGSGVIAVSLAYHLPHARLTATDISSHALEVARENACRHRVEKRIAFDQGDFFNTPACQRAFHVIASNPPYISSKELKEVSGEVGKEPLLALDGGEDGLLFYKLLIKEASTHIKKPGLLALEIGCNQQGSIIKMAEKAGCFKEVKLKKDFAGLHRVIMAFTG